MSIYYGDMPVGGGGSGKTEWDKIEGKPFWEDGLKEEVIISSTSIYNADESDEQQYFIYYFYDTGIVDINPRIIQEGYTYKIEINGNSYTGECAYFGSGFVGASADDGIKYCYYFGNPALAAHSGIGSLRYADIIDYEDNGQDFAVYEIHKGSGYDNDSYTIICFVTTSIEAFSVNESYDTKLYEITKQTGKLYEDYLPSHEHTLSDLPITFSTFALIDGTSYLEAGTLYFVYEE